MNEKTDFEEGVPRDVLKPTPSVFPFGFRTGRSNDILFLEFLDNKGSHLEVLSSTALDVNMAVDIREKLNEFIASVLEPSENGEE